MPVPRPAFFISLRLPASLSTNKIHPTTPPHDSTIGKLSHCFPPHASDSSFIIQNSSLNTVRPGLALFSSIIQNSSFIIKHRPPHHATAQFDNWQIVALLPTPRFRFIIQHSKFIIKHRPPAAIFPERPRARIKPRAMHRAQRGDDALSP
jgi:hypothetical protein